MVRPIIDAALDNLIQTDLTLFIAGLHEQTLVSRLAHHIQILLTPETGLHDYFVDVEYNRANGGVQKFLAGDTRVFVDLVLHGRGQVNGHENIACIEMKKRISTNAWANVDGAEGFIFANNANNAVVRQKLTRDQNKLLSFTTDGDPHNLRGFVVGYQLGVLLVPRYHGYTNNGIELATIPQIFVRYYENGAVIANGDRLINIPV